jgi:hypothetical protein
LCGDRNVRREQCNLSGALSGWRSRVFRLFCGDGKEIFSGSSDQSLQVWKPAVSTIDAAELEPLAGYGDALEVLWSSKPVAVSHARATGSDLFPSQ